MMILKELKRLLKQKNELDKGDRVIIFIDDFFENKKKF